MERFALLILTLVLGGFVVLGLYAGLRRKDSFWDNPPRSRRRRAPDGEARRKRL